MKQLQVTLFPLEGRVTPPLPNPKAFCHRRYPPGWRKALWDLNVLPKNTTSRSFQPLHHSIQNVGPSNALILKSPRFQLMQYKEKANALSIQRNLNTLYALACYLSKRFNSPKLINYRYGRARSLDSRSLVDLAFGFAHWRLGMRLACALRLLPLAWY